MKSGSTFQQPWNYAISIPIMIPPSFLCGFKVNCFYDTLHELPLRSFTRDHANWKQKRIMTTLWQPLLFLRSIKPNDNSYLPMRRRSLPTAGKDFIFFTVNASEMNKCFQGRTERCTNLLGSMLQAISLVIFTFSIKSPHFFSKIIENTINEPFNLKI